MSRRAQKPSQPPSRDERAELEALIVSWERSLRAANKSPRTIRTYGDDARLLVSWLSAHNTVVSVEKLTRAHLESFIEDQLSRHKPTTAAVRYRSLQQFFKWLLEEGEISVSPMARMRPPAVPETPVPVVPDEDLRKLLATCATTSFEDRRDLALLRVMIDTGIRLSEAAGMTLSDVDFETDVIVVLGKGRRPRAVPFGPKTATALDRYVRVRARHRRASDPGFWLGPQGALGTSGITQVLRRRCRQAGIAQIHPHQLRHTAVHAWLATGGEEGDAMRIFGWKSRDMLSRYGASRADERARESFRRLLPGDRI